MDDATALRTLLAGPDPVPIARALLGVEIVTTVGGVVTSGFITETEAYRAPEDQASHARNHRRTPRTEVFVYSCVPVDTLDVALARLDDWLANR